MLARFTILYSYHAFNNNYASLLLAINALAPANIVIINITANPKILVVSSVFGVEALAETIFL